MDTKLKRTITLNSATTPILYTDRIFISANQFGLVFDVTQRIGDKTQIVARVGMSREHAKKIASELGKMLAVTERVTKPEQN